MDPNITFFNHACRDDGLDVLYATFSKETSTKAYGKLEQASKKAMKSLQLVDFTEQWMK